MKKLLFLLLLLLLIYGCATTRLRYKETQSIEELEQVYSSLKEAYDKNPNNSKIKSKFEDIKKILAGKHYYKTYEVNKYNFPAKRILLQKALDLDPVQENISRELSDINKKIESIDKQAKSALEEELLECLKRYLPLREYEAYFDSVKQLRGKITSSESLLEGKIEELAKSNKDNEAFSFLIAAGRVFSNNLKIKSIKEKLFSKNASFAISISEKYANIENNDRLATSLIYLLVAWNYDKEMPGLKENISEKMNQIRRVIVPNLIVNFSDSFSDKQKNEILSFLRIYKELGAMNDIKEISDDYETSNNDVIIALYLNDLSIDVKSDESVKYSKYLAGYQSVPNPTYNSLVAQYNQALQLTQYYRNLVNQNPYNYAAGFLAGFYQGTCNKLSSQLASTPRYLQEPVYQDYQYIQVDYNYHLHFEVKYELIDSLTQQALKQGMIDNRDKEERVFISGAHPKDYYGLRDKKVAESETADILKDFSKESFISLSKIIRDLVEKKSLYEAKETFEENNYGEAVEKIFIYKLLRSLCGIEATTEFTDRQIDNITENLNMIKAKDNLEKITPDEYFNLDLSIQSIFKNSFYTDYSVPEEFTDIREVFNYFDAGKFEYSKKDKVLLSKLKSFKIGKLFSKFRKDKKIIITKSHQNPVGECLPSVVVVKTSIGSGSGFILNDKGYIVTNYHVVTNQDDIIVKTKDGGKFFADLVAMVKYKDLALLKINARDIQPIKLGNVNEVTIGETVYAIGAPMGLKGETFEQTVTKGIVSSVRSLEAPYNPLEKILFIQTDAAINPGNSGGPLINEKGEVIGVNCQKIVATNVEGLNFAVAIDELKKSFSEYLK